MAAETGDKGWFSTAWRRSRGLWRNFAARPVRVTNSENQQPAVKFSFADPTIGLFGADDENDQSPASMPLTTQLEESAHAIVMRAARLREDADRLVQRIGERAEAEITLGAQAIRVLIGLGWLGIAAWLYNGALVARANDMAVLTNGMPADDALILSRTFLIVAAVGLGVAFGVGALVSGVGKSGFAPVRREAERLGNMIADISEDFDKDLDGFRSQMDQRGNPADGIADLSRAHLTALEASAFFREIAFLTHSNAEEAARFFRGFLRRPNIPPPAAPVFLIGLLFGALAGAAYVYRTYVPKPEVIVEPVTPLAIAQYPWAINVLFFGGVAYASIGIVLSILGAPLAASAAARARSEALEAMRSAFAGREAPRPADVVRRIEDAVDVFRARVGGRSTRASAAPTNQLSEFSTNEDDIPHWRRRDSSVSFVETGFQSAPQRWRTDAYAKKMSAGPDAKRGLSKLKKGDPD